MSTLRVFPEPDALAQAAVEAIRGAAAAAVRARGVFFLALSGGTTPRSVYLRLAQEREDFARWQFCFGDERCVPPEHPDSNYGMVREALLARAAIPPGNVHRIPAEREPAAAAAAYREELRRAVPEQPPRFDLLLLGMGADGHTASLFPGSAALEERERSVVENWVPGLQAWRITLTLPVLNAARAALFLVSGAAKAEALRAVLQPDRALPPLPAARVAPQGGSVLWLADRAAATLLVT